MATLEWNAYLLAAEISVITADMQRSICQYPPSFGKGNNSTFGAQEIHPDETHRTSAASRPRRRWT